MNKVKNAIRFYKIIINHLYNFKCINKYLYENSCSLQFSSAVKQIRLTF